MVMSEEPVSPVRLQPKVPRDLETICLRCLEKEPHRRYASAEALAEDLRRFQNGEPIQARPAGRVEKLWRWCRRNPVVAGLTAGLLLVFALGFGGVLWKWREAVQARHEAEKSEAKAQAVNKFLIKDLFHTADPEGRGPDVTLKQALDEAVAKIPQAFADQPEVEASVRDTLGQTYWKLGLLAQAEKQLRAALDLYRRLNPDDHRDTLNALNNLATVLMDGGKLNEAEPLFGEALAGFRRTVPPDNLDRLTALHNLASLQYSQGKLAEAEPLMREVREVCRRKYGPDDSETLQAENNLARQGAAAP
jgi:hypothetical protein